MSGARASSVAGRSSRPSAGRSRSTAHPPADSARTADGSRSSVKRSALAWRARRRARAGRADERSRLQEIAVRGASRSRRIALDLQSENVRKMSGF